MRRSLRRRHRSAGEEEFHFLETLQPVAVLLYSTAGTRGVVFMSRIYRSADVFVLAK